VLLRHRLAFTLIELLVVIVIVGIIAAIAIPKFSNTKGKANAAALRSDLHGLAVAQEAYFYEKHVYAGDTSELNFSTSPGVTISMTAPPTGGWVATATHPLAVPRQCTLFYGNMTPPPPAQVEGVPACQ
jgi:prepilin-type N-terminal cleavage/methylation domain-containing protein